MNSLEVTTASPAPLLSADARRKALLLLLSANLGWGWSFPAMKTGCKALASLAPDADETAVSAVFIGWRFALATLCYAALYFRDLRGFSRADVLGGLATGLAFVAGLFFQILGLRYTLPSISGFLTALVVILVPLTQALLLRRRPPWQIWPVAALAVTGLVILSWPAADGEPGRLAGPFPFFGETLTIAGSVCFTAQVLLLDRYGQRAQSTRLTFIQFGVVAAVGLAASLICKGGPAFHRPPLLDAAWTDWSVSWAVLSTALFSTVFAFHLMNENQPKLPASTAGVIYCAEPLCATLFSIGLGMEGLRANLLAGGGLIVGAILWIGQVTAGRPSTPLEKALTLPSPARGEGEQQPFFQRTAGSEKPLDGVGAEAEKNPPVG